MYASIADLVFVGVFGVVVGLNLNLLASSLVIAGALFDINIVDFSGIFVLVYRVCRSLCGLFGW